MEIKLTEDGLKVGKWKCHDATIYKKGIFSYEFHLHNIEGWTYKKEIIKCGLKSYKTMRITKKIKGSQLIYSGNELKDGYSHKENEIYKHASNIKGNYVNYYEQKDENN